MAKKPLKTVDDVVARLEKKGTVLNIWNEQIGDAGAQLVAAALPQCKDLDYLDLRYNSIGADGARALAAVLPQCTALQKLVLDCNNIGDDGARALAAALPQCTALQTLDLGRNNIGDDGARALAAALPQCTALQELDLNSNNIGADGARSLATVLPQCTALQKLYLDSNRIGNDGARALLAALPQCPSIQTLSRSNNIMSAAIHHQIEAELIKNNQPQRVHEAAAKHAQALAERAAKKAAEERASQQVIEAAGRAADAKAAAERAAQQEAERLRAQQAADEARRRALPKPSTTPSPPLAAPQWVAQVDPATGQAYYYNPSTGESMWTPPSPLTSSIPPPAPKPSSSSSSAVAVITQQLHQFALSSPEAGATSTSSPSPQLQAMEKELQTLRAQTAGTQAALAKAAADAQSLSAAQAAKLLEQAAASAAAMQRESSAQMASMEKRLVGQLNGLASEQEKVKVVLLYVEAKLASYLPMLDEAVAKRELDKVRSALNARIRASPKHDAYHRAFLEVLNATYQAAMVLKTDFVALQSQSGATKAAGVVEKIGAAVGAALSFTPASPLAGMALGAATSLASFFLSRIGEHDQRDQLGRLTDAFPSPPVWFDVAERVAAAATEAKWEAIAKLEVGGASANKIFQFLENAAVYLQTHSTPPIWQRTAAMDALAGLDAIMQGTLRPPVDVDNAIKVLVAAALKDAPAPKPTPPPSVGISKAQEAETKKNAVDAKRAAEQAELAAKQLKQQLANSFGIGASSPTVAVAERVVTVRTWSKRKMDGGKRVTVTADLVTLKADAGKALGITVASLRDSADGAEIENIAHIEHKAILIATTADEERLHY